VPVRELSLRQAESLTALDLEARPFDRRPRVARKMAVAERSRPERCVGGALERPADRVARHDVLVEVKGSAGSEHPAELGQRRRLVGD